MEPIETCRPSDLLMAATTRSRFTRMRKGITSAMISRIATVTRNRIRKTRRVFLTGGAVSLAVALFTGLYSRNASFHAAQGPAPAGFIEEVQYLMPKQEAHLLFHRKTFHSLGCLKRPVNKERSADYVFFGHKAPVAAVVAYVAMVAHGEIAIFGDDQLVILYVR